MAGGRNGLGDAQRGKRLTRAAGHDELTAIRLREPFDHVLQGSRLVEAEFFLRRERELAGLGASKVLQSMGLWARS